MSNSNFTKHATVEDTARQQLIYIDEPTVNIKGTRLSREVTLYWLNGLRGGGIDYATTVDSGNSLTLHLAPGALWIRNAQINPAHLQLTSIGDGGAVVNTLGTEVALVFQRPVLYTNNQPLIRTQTRSFRIQGTGFPDPMYRTAVKFSPPLREGVDYTIAISIPGSEIDVYLMHGKAWRPDAGPLFVTAINTRGDGGGWIELPGSGVYVADIIDDRGTTTVSTTALAGFATVFLLVVGVTVYACTMLNKYHRGLVALTEREFEMSQRRPMAISATDVMLCADEEVGHDDETGGGGDAHTEGRSNEHGGGFVAEAAHSLLNDSGDASVPAEP